MDWREYIHSDPDMLAGKPAVKGTRVAERVLNGGHNVPKDVIIRRYEAGLSNFFRVYQPARPRTSITHILWATADRPLFYNLQYLTPCFLNEMLLS